MWLYCHRVLATNGKLLNGAKGLTLENDWIAETS